MGIGDFFARLFGKGPAAKAPAARRPAAGRPANRPQISGALDEFDLASISEFSADKRRTLTDEDRAKTVKLVPRIVERFEEEKGNVPAFPSRTAGILGIVERPDFDVEQLVRAIQRDPLVSASVLRAANSAAYAGVTKIENIRDGVVRLGAQVVASIATAVATRGLFDAGAQATRSQFGEEWNRLWLHSVTTAFAAGGYTVSSRSGNLERCFLGGMLHDIGKTFALRTLGDLVLASEIKGGFSPALLAELIESVHLQIGKSLAVAWKLPDFVVRACSDHHGKADTADRDLNIIRVVSGLNEIRLNAQHRSDLAGEVRQSARSLGMDAFKLRAVATELKTHAAKAALL